MQDMTQIDHKTIIGPGEYIDLPKLGLKAIPAKTDTGAYYSSIWASNIKVSKGGDVSFILFGESSPYYTGEVISILAKDARIVSVANSFGIVEQRVKLKIAIVVRGRRIRATFTLADRSKKVYPILLGKRLLFNKFLVDTSLDQPYSRAEASDYVSNQEVSHKQFEQE